MTLPLAGLRCEQVHRPANLLEEAAAFAMALGEPYATKVACHHHDYYVGAGLKGDATSVLLADGSYAELFPSAHVPPRILLTDKEWV